MNLIKLKIKYLLSKIGYPASGIQHPASRKGFTLIEMLVALAIFSTALVVISNIFVLAGRAQNKAAEIEKVHSGARLAMETMVREIRAGKINYNKYLNNINLAGEDELALLDAEGRSIIFYGGDCINDSSRKCLKISINDGQEAPKVADITSNDSKLIDLKFYIRPLSDPFMPLPAGIGDCLVGFDEDNSVCTCGDVATDCYPDQTCETTSVTDFNICVNANIQPMVTIKFVSQSAKAIHGEQPLVALQTTVSTKNYER